MDELAKINRIIDNKAGDCSREVLLVLDATTGQNAVNQAKLFSETAPITGIVLTKLDGTAKGGIVISIKNELGIPVKLIGVGEKIDDLQPFDSRSFVQALFSDADFEDDDEAGEETELSESDEEAEEEAVTEEISFDDENETENESVSEIEAAEIEESEDIDSEDEVSEKIDEEDEVDEEADLAEAEKAVYEYFGGKDNVEIVDEDSEDSEEILETEDENGDSETEETEETNESDESDVTESEEAPEEEAEPEKKKKRGFFSRIFGRKDEEDD